MATLNENVRGDLGEGGLAVGVREDERDGDGDAGTHDGVARERHALDVCKDNCAMCVRSLRDWQHTLSIQDAAVHRGPVTVTQ